MNRVELKGEIERIFSSAFRCRVGVDDQWSTAEAPERCADAPAGHIAIEGADGTVSFLLDSGCGAWRVRLEGLTSTDARSRGMITELGAYTARMLAEELRREERKSQPRPYFLKRLLDCRNEEDDISVEAWNARMGYDLGAARAACVLAPDLRGRAEFDEAALRRALHDKARGHPSIRTDDIVEYAGRDRLVVLKTVAADRFADYRTELAAFAADMDSFTRRRFSAETGCGIGFCYEGPRLLKLSYEEAVFALEAAGGKGISSIDRFMVEYLTEKIPERALDHFLGEKLASLAARPELLETVRALSASRMRPQEAADALAVHKNTLLLRFKAIKELLGIDPFVNEDDRMILRFLAAYSLRPNRLRKTASAAAWTTTEKPTRGHAPHRS